MSRALLLRPVLAALALLAPLASAAHADPSPPSKVDKPKVTVEILSDVTAVAPGESFRLGAKFTTEPGWHLYWRNSGDTGIPTQLALDAPDGYDFGPIRWPVPNRFVAKSGDVTFGYEGELVLLSNVQVPADALEGSDVPLAVKAQWLICRENCIQGSADLVLHVQVAATPRAVRAQPETTALFDRWDAKVPVPAEKGPSVKAVSKAPPAKPGATFAIDATLHGAQPLAPPVDPTAAFLPATSAGLHVDHVTVDTGADPHDLIIHIAGTAGPEADPLVSKLEGIFQVTDGGAPLAFEGTLDVPRAPGPAVVAAPPDTGSGNPTLAAGPGVAMGAPGSVCEGVSGDAGSSNAPLASFMVALAFAFLGGLLLNAMPCVLPVLSLKILGLVEQAREDKKVIWRHGLAYTGGVLLSFAVLAAILLGLKATSWAFQMQEPVFVATFTAIVFGFALSLFGVFELALPFASRLDQTVARSHGYWSSFNYGVFAVLLGTPCTAPFIGPAMGYAFTQPPVEMVILLLTVGLGLAFPFLVLARFPAWRRIVPRPGPWLLTFKKVMGFLLVGTALFLLSTLAAEVSRDAFVGYLVFLAVLSFALWIYGHWAAPERTARTRGLGTAAAIAVGVIGGVLFVSTEAPPAAGDTRTIGGIVWHEWGGVDVEKAAAEGHTVFIDFTADWCVTCKSNEATAIYTDRVRQAFSELHIMPVKGDFTRYDPHIADWLQRFHAPSVPLYVVIPAGKPEQAFALPTLLSTDDVIGGLCRAGPSRVTTAGR